MNATEAKQVIEVLASGIDPETGEVLADSSPLNNPHVIRALFLASKALDLLASQPKPRTKPARAANTGKAWTQEEEQQLATGFHAGTAVAVLAKTHERTNGAIRSRLIRMGLLQDEENTSSG